MIVFRLRRGKREFGRNVCDKIGELRSCGLDRSRSGLLL